MIFENFDLPSQPLPVRQEPSIVNFLILVVVSLVVVVLVVVSTSRILNAFVILCAISLAAGVVAAAFHYVRSEQLRTLREKEEEEEAARLDLLRMYQEQEEQAKAARREQIRIRQEQEEQLLAELREQDRMQRERQEHEERSQQEQLRIRRKQVELQELFLHEQARLQQEQEEQARREQARIRQERDRKFRAAVCEQLNTRPISSLDLGKLVAEYEVSAEEAGRVAKALYAKFCKQVLADAQVTKKERLQLDCLRQVLAIPDPVGADIEANLRDERYQAAAHEALADGTITSEEAAELERMRSHFGLSDSRAWRLVEPTAVDAYLALFRKVISDGRITAEELDELRRFQEGLGLSRSAANDIVRGEVLGLYKQWFCNIVQNGRVTPEEEQGLAWLRGEFGLEESDTHTYDSQLQEVKLLATYREGNLPVVKTSKLLEGGEICHWEGQGRFQWETATQTKDAIGELVVTSEQVVFTSPLRSFSFSPARVMDIQIYSDALVLQTSSSRGGGTYFVSRPRELEAILFGLVKRHKFQVCTDYSSDLTRHIPDNVKKEVFQRDGGRCVRCGARDYLEFDHMIPHTKGGANTVGNVQILCRRCNNWKSDRI